MKTLFTNNHVLNDKKINKNSIIKIMYNNKVNEIKITENRFTYTNEELDYTCVIKFEQIQIFKNLLFKINYKKRNIDLFL